MTSPENAGNAPGGSRRGGKSGAGNRAGSGGQGGGGKAGGGGGKASGGGGKPGGGGGKASGGGGKASGKGGGGRGGGNRGQSGNRGKGGGRPNKPAPEVSRADELAKPLARVLERIPATQREVLEWRMGLKDGHPHDLSSTAKQLGLSIAETKQIEQRAFEHIREVVPLQQLQKLLGG